MVIIGLTGGIGHGKSTLAEFLAKQAHQSRHWESSDIICQVATRLRTSGLPTPPADDLAAINRWLAPLPTILASVVHIDVIEPIYLNQSDLDDRTEPYVKLVDYFKVVKAQPDLAVGPITALNKQALRSLLQWLGGYLAKHVACDIWYNEIIRQIRATPGLQLATIGGVRFPADADCVRSAGGKVIGISRPKLLEADLQDVTERERSLIQPDCIIINDASLPELAACAQSVYQAIEADRLRPAYRASSYWGSEPLPKH